MVFVVYGGAGGLTAVFLAAGLRAGLRFGADVAAKASAAGAATVVGAAFAAASVPFRTCSRSQQFLMGLPHVAGQFGQVGHVQRNLGAGYVGDGHIMSVLPSARRLTGTAASSGTVGTQPRWRR